MSDEQRVDLPADKPLIALGSILARLGVKFLAKCREFRTPEQGEIEYIRVFNTYPVVNVMVHGMNYILAGSDDLVQVPLGEYEELFTKIRAIRVDVIRKSKV